MNNYIDMIMTNKIFASESSEEIIQHGGGDVEKNDFPTGGFPPIVVIEKEKALQQEANKNRELSSVASGISIKDILSKQKV